ncbi:MAG: DEAD/DEAH box helicase family protein, partial [Gammaproteobacteria bacterium]|nr:DEAD/DEAH box helicase family protein [Gammaproteobacteria bacterium]
MATHSDAPVFLRVAVPSPLRQQFDYLPPVGGGFNPCIGARIQVPFGHRSVTGLVTAIETQTQIATRKLKRAEEILDKEPLLPETMLALLLRAAEYYHHPLGDVISTAIPALLRQGETPKSFEERLISEPGTDSNQIKGIRQKEILNWLHEAPHGLTREELRSRNYTSAALNSLEKKGLVKWQIKDLSVNPWNSEPFWPGKMTNESDLQPNKEQQAAIATITAPTDKAGAFLLAGVTGSGKTEVYLRVIESVLQQGRQVLVLVPEIGLTPQTLERFTQRFNLPIV